MDMIDCGFALNSRVRIPNEEFDVPESFFDDDLDLNFSDFEDDSETNSLNDSLCSSCSCSHCDSTDSCNSFETTNNNKDSADIGHKEKTVKKWVNGGK